MQYETAALSKATVIFIIVLFVLLPIGLVTMTVVTVNDQQLTWKIAWPVAVIMFLIGLACLRRGVALEGDILQIKAAMYTHQVNVHDINLEQTRLLDLQEKIQAKPKWRTNGYSLPGGFNAGYYRGYQKQKMFCLVTSPRVLKLPLRDGTEILLSLEQPQILLDRLHHLTRS
jgi:hypothetical protein